MYDGFWYNDVTIEDLLNTMKEELSNIKLPHKTDEEKIMVDKICDYLTNKIRKQMPEVDDEKAEVINYGIQLIVGEIPKTFVFILIAAVLGVLKEFFITILVIFPYRAFSGGFHLKTHLGCILGTTLMYCGIAYISQFQLFNNDIKNILS